MIHMYKNDLDIFLMCYIKVNNLFLLGYKLISLIVNHIQGNIIK